jgi:hypothetical protein
VALEHLEGGEAKALVVGDRLRLRVDHHTRASVLAGQPQRELKDEAQKRGSDALALGGQVTARA